MAGVSKDDPRLAEARSRGLWDYFAAVRDRRRKAGLKPAEAVDSAFQQVCRGTFPVGGCECGRTAEEHDSGGGCSSNLGRRRRGTAMESLGVEVPEIREVDDIVESMRVPPPPVYEPPVPEVDESDEAADPEAGEDFVTADYAGVPDRECSYPQRVRWVAAVLHRLDVNQGDAPSAAAWSMLMWARASKANEASFWAQIDKAASKDEERGAGMSDDGREIDALIVDHLVALGAKAIAVAGLK